MKYWERIQNFDEELLRRNVSLTLHLVQGLAGTKVQYANNAPEVDHIFPKAELAKKDFEPGLINHFANYWILAKGKNRNKSDKHPAKYLEDVADEDLKRALIPREMLDYRRYGTFLEKRSAAMLETVGKKLNMSDKDFESQQNRENAN